MGKHGYNPGDLGWTELNTTDAGAALEFYRQIAGWEKQAEPMPGCNVVGSGEEMLGGIQNLKDGESTPRWMPYITVADIEATLAKVKELGGSQIGETAPLPDGGKMAVIKDPQGAVTGLAQYAGSPDA
jgi:uncharacterized protein